MKDKDIAAIGVLLGATALYLAVADSNDEGFPRGGGSGAVYSLPVGLAEKKASVKEPSQPAVYNITVEAPTVPSQPSITEVREAVVDEPVKTISRTPSPPPPSPDPVEPKAKKEEKITKEDLSPVVRDIVEAPSYMLDADMKKTKKEVVKQVYDVPVLDEYMYVPPDAKTMVNPWGYPPMAPEPVKKETKKQESSGNIFDAVFNTIGSIGNMLFGWLR